MSLLPKTRQEFSEKEYWESFFKKRGGKAFEWYGEYPELCDHLHKYIKVKDDILVTGCGNSNLSSDLFDVGFKKITNIDISQVVIRQMNNLHGKQRPELKFLQMDVFNMNFDNDTFSVVLDKGTLDALLPDNCSESIQKIQKYFEEISRVLRTGGRYICVSLLQEHILKTILDYFPENSWMFRVVRCHQAEKIEESDHLMPVFMIICTKFNNLPRQILEVNVYSEDKIERMQNCNEITNLIATIQKAAFVSSGLRNTNISDQEQVSFDLYKQGEDTPRYTINVVDLPPDRKQGKYAAFIVPNGREVEWMFSTAKGRKHLATITKYNRLAVVTLHRNQKYENLEAIQSELNDAIRNFTPTGCTDKIPFLSINSDIGVRMFQHQGHSEISGDYIIEDVCVEGSKFRRLFYMSSQSVIQSEAKLKSVKNRKGGTKDVVNHGSLTCRHHVYMSIKTLFACEDKKDPSILVIGLGGGGLCMFLRRFLPKVHITAVDIDGDMLNVAKDWFGLKEDNQLKVSIIDGLEYLTNTSKKGHKFDAILFDVDSKDATIGISCPPKEFLQKEAFDNVKLCLKPKGLFILNLVARDQSLKPDLLRDLKSHFETVISYQLEDELNQIIGCSLEKYDKNLLINKLKSAGDKYERFRKSIEQDEEVFETDNFATNLTFLQ